MNSIETIENLTTASAHLAFIQDVLHRNKLTPELKRKASFEMELIQKRIADENLYITVVGGFSTGKSTLINAFLKDILLESSVLSMTTAVATFVRYGKELSLEVRFKNAKAISVLGFSNLKPSNTRHDAEILLEGMSLDTSYLWQATVADEPIEIDGEKKTIRELIRLFTSVPKFAEHIASISITHPSDFLKSGIVIIDTPGADATNETHKEITHNAVERSDAAIIVTPAEQAVSGWLKETLKEQDFLYPLLHRCVFMLSRMDIAVERMRRTDREKAIELVYRDAFQRLKAALVDAKLNKEPRLFSCAAQAVLDEISGDGPLVLDAQEREYWQKEFHKFQEDFVDYMVCQRAETIADKVLRLVEDIFTSLEVILSGLWSDYNQRISQFKTITRDLDSFCAEEKAKLGNQIFDRANDSAYEVEMKIEKERDKSLKSIRNAIYAAENGNELENLANHGIKGILEESSKNIQSSIKSQTKKIKEAAILFNDEFERTFNSLYEQLKIIGSGEKAFSKTKLNLSSNISSVGLSSSSSIGEINIGNLLSGAVIGGLIGSIIPGIGTMVGAIVGGFLSAVFGGLSDEKKTEIWNEIEPKVIDFYFQIQSEAKAAIENYGDEVYDSILDRIDEHAEFYREEVGAIRKNQIQEQVELKRLQSALEADLSRLKEHRLQIKEQKENLRLQITALTA